MENIFTGTGIRSINNAGMKKLKVSQILSPLTAAILIQA